MSKNPWEEAWDAAGQPGTSPEEFDRVMRAFDEIQAGYDRDRRKQERRFARQARQRAALRSSQSD